MEYSGKIVFPMRNSEALGKSVAEKLGAEEGLIESKRFPDGEFYLRFRTGVKGKEIVLVQSLYPEPNEAIIELVFAAKTAKELGAKKVTGIVPYLAYMRQDGRFNEGECVSNRLMAWLLNSSLDSIMTVDPHLHRVRHLAELFHIERKRLSANNDIARFIKKNFSRKDSVIVGPDIESSQWAKKIADSMGFESAIFLKKRFSSRKVKIHVTKELEWRKKNVVIVDDIVSSGHTMIEAVKEIRKRKPKSVHCICVHAIFAENAFEKLKKAGAKTISSCNTIEHKSNRIDLSGMIAKEI